jgi:Na+/proline symporter
MVFGLGILWPGLTEAGALTGLIVGLFLGLLKFIFGNVYPPSECGQLDERPDFVKMHFMWYGKWSTSGAFDKWTIETFFCIIYELKTKLYLICL